MEKAKQRLDSKDPSVTAAKMSDSKVQSCRLPKKEALGRDPKLRMS